MTRTDPYAARADHGPWRFLHRLNPLSKFAATLPALVALIVARGLATPLAFIAVTLALLLIGAKLSARVLAGLLLGLPAAAAVIALSFGLWADPGTAAREGLPLQTGDNRVLDALAIGAPTALRLTSLVLLTLVVGLTTTGPDLARSLTQQLRVPYRVSYSALAAFRFVPRLSHDLQLIQAAHRVRGIDGGHGPVAAIRRRIGWSVPLLAGAIRHAERVALVMDARGFGAHPTRTERHLVPFRTRDWTFTALFWATTALIALTLWNR